jgi:glycosyltransferase involved in cell wall biosynthesis
METLVEHAEAVTAGSRTIADWARASQARRVVEVPSVVDPGLYPVRPLPDGPFTIGWIGTPKNEPFLELIAEPLRELHERFGARLRVIGGSGSLELPGVAIDRVPWSEATEAEELTRCHVGVMPLTDGAWERGKCGYKLVQYMAAARAAVASPVGPSSSIILHGHTGFLAGTPEEWVTALGTLAADRSLVQSMGQAARQRVEGSYSLAVAAPRMAELLHSALLPSSSRRFAADLELVAK